MYLIAAFKIVSHVRQLMQRLFNDPLGLTNEIFVSVWVVGIVFRSPDLPPCTRLLRTRRAASNQSEIVLGGAFSSHSRA